MQRVYNKRMIKRMSWLAKIKEAWKQKSVIWLSGVRRAGKTFLTRSIDDA